MGYALNGIVYAFKTEKNIRFLSLVIILVTLLGIILNISSMEWIAVLLCFGGICASELLNTAIENLSDRVTKKHDEEIKRTKDLAAGATMLISIASFISFLIIFVPKIINKF